MLLHPEVIETSMHTFTALSQIKLRGQAAPLLSKNEGNCTCSCSLALKQLAIETKLLLKMLKITLPLPDFFKLNTQHCP